MSTPMRQSDIYEMESLMYTDRHTIIVKPEQSGKTFLLIQSLIDDLNEGKDVINIVFCDNNLLLTSQTTTRVKDGLKKCTDEIKYLQLSSSKQTTCHNYKEAMYGILVEGITTIVCCSNNKRMTDVEKIIKDLKKSVLGTYNIKIWLDEADKYIKDINGHIYPIMKKYDDVELYSITATPEKLFNKFKELRVFAIEKTTCQNYSGWIDCEITRICGISMSTIEFALWCIEDKKEYFTPGTMWYIPSDYTKESHVEMADALVENGFAVMTINGDGITLNIPDKANILMKKEQEINKIIEDLYKSHNLNDYPVAITGNTCVSRGITIQSEFKMFTGAILSNVRNKTEASQMAGRVKGVIKGWSNYKPPIVFTTTKFDKIAKECEQLSSKLAEIAFEKYEDDDEKYPLINKDDVIECKRSYSITIHPRLFRQNEIEEIKELLKELGISGNLTGERAKHKTEDGYTLSSKLHKKKQIISTLSKDFRSIINTNKNIPGRGNCLAQTSYRAVIFPVYEDETTPADNYKWQLRYINKP